MSHASSDKSPALPMDSNSMLRYMYKQGMCRTLARIPLFVDLADAEAVACVNNALKASAPPSGAPTC